MLILGLLGMYFDAAIVFVKSQTDTFIKIGCGHTVTYMGWYGIRYI